MKKLSILLLSIFLLCEYNSHAQKQTIINTLDTKVINNPSLPMRASDLNAILKSILNYPVDTLWVSGDSIKYKISGVIKTVRFTGYLDSLTALQSRVQTKQPLGSYLVSGNNLADVSNIITARSNLNVFSKADTTAPGGMYPWSNPLSFLTANTAKYQQISKGDTVKPSQLRLNLSNEFAVTDGAGKTDVAIESIASTKVIGLSTGAYFDTSTLQPRFDQRLKLGDTTSMLSGYARSGNVVKYTDVGANNGVAGLDAGGKVPFSQLPASLYIYKGTWDASTNTPTLANGSGTSGWVYQASVAGTVNFGAGNITFAAGDYVGYNGSIWQWSPGTSAVKSVNGQQGIVSLTTANIPEGGTDYYWTAARSRAAQSSAVTGLSYDNTTGVLSNTSGYVIPTTSEQSNWNTAYGWGNHALAGYLTTSIAASTYTPLTRTLTINGVTYDLSANRSWTINSMVYPGAGIAVSTGTAWGTSITDNSANWNTAYSWGNWAAGSHYVGTTSIANNRASASQTLTGVSIDGNASTVTNGVYTTGSYADPAWITSLAYGKLTGAPSLTGYVPYTGATGNVNIGTNSLSAGAISGTTGTFSGDVGIGISTSNPIGNGGTFRNLLVGNGAGYGVFQAVSTATASGSIIAAFSGGTTGASSANKNVGSINIALDGTSTTNAIGRIEFYTASGSGVALALTLNSSQAATFASSVTATSFIKSGGTSSQFLKADGSVDGSTYLTGNQTITLSGEVTGSGSTAITTTLATTIANAHTFNGVISMTSNTASSSYTTGSLVVTGGVGVSGDVRTGGDVIAYSTSDSRYKDNQQLIINPIGKLLALKGITFDWNDKQKVYTGHDYGLVYQDVFKVMPEITTLRANGYGAVKYEKVVPLLVEVGKNHEQRIAELEAEIQSLKKLLK